jgi:hypothetical protein
MTQAHTFTLKTDILSVQVSEEGCKGYLYVPAGAIISVPDLNPNDSIFVEVFWDSKKVMMFPQDIQERTEPLSSPAYAIARQNSNASAAWSG